MTQRYDQSRHPNVRVPAGWVVLILACSGLVQGQVEVTRDNRQSKLSIDNEVVATSPNPIENAQVQQVPGSDIRFSTWTTPKDQDDPDALQVYHYAVKLGDRDWTEPKQTSYVIKLKNRQFEPTTDDAIDAAVAALPRALRTVVTDVPALYLVQFHTQILKEYRDGVEEQGGQVLGYIPELTHLVRMAPRAADQVRQLPYVRWVGPLLPYYKVEREILAAFRHGVDEVAQAGDDTPTRYVIVVPDAESRANLLQRLQQLEATVVERGEGSRLVVAELTLSQLEQFLASDSVEWVERATKPEVDVDRAREIGGANFLETTAPGGYTGIGIRGHVMEGIYSNHPDFAANSHRQAPIAVNDPSPDNHGQQTYGEIFGAGTGDPLARGLIPNAQGFYTNYNFVYSATPGSTAAGSRHELVGRLIRDHHVMFQTASWGYERTTEYTARSQEMDDLIFGTTSPSPRVRATPGRETQGRRHGQRTLSRWALHITSTT